MTTSVVPNKGSPLLPRTLATFRREVAGLLTITHKYTREHALRAIAKWDLYLRKRWSDGKPPCHVADHIYRWEKEQVIVCPCGRRTSPSHDPDRCRHRHRTSRARIQHHTRRSRRHSRRVSRDAENPRSGEIFESRAGKRWRIDDVNEGRIVVESAGVRQVGRLVWKKENLKGMRMVQGDPEHRRRSRTGSFVQSLVFSRREFTRERAMRWAEQHGFHARKVDLTPRSIRLRQHAPSSVHIVGSKRIAKGVVAIVARR